MTREEIFKFAEDYFGTKPEYPWEDTPEAAVLRNKNKKWYGLLMSVQKNRLGLDGEEKTDILNVKCDPILIGSLRLEKGFLPAYHMNKTHWITILTDEVSKEQITDLISLSYELTQK